MRLPFANKCSRKVDLTGKHQESRSIAPTNAATEPTHIFACFSTPQMPSEIGSGWQQAREACPHARDAFRPGVPRILVAGRGSPGGGWPPPRPPFPPLVQKVPPKRRSGVTQFGQEYSQFWEFVWKAMYNPLRRGFDDWNLSRSAPVMPTTAGRTLFNQSPAVQ